MGPTPSHIITGNDKQDKAAPVIPDVIQFVTCEHCGSQTMALPSARSVGSRTRVGFWHRCNGCGKRKWHGFYDIILESTK